MRNPLAQPMEVSPLLALALENSRHFNPNLIEITMHTATISHLKGVKVTNIGSIILDGSGISTFDRKKISVYLGMVINNSNAKLTNRIHNDPVSIQSSERPFRTATSEVWVVFNLTTMRFTYFENIRSMLLLK
ncbi:MAG: hypothetical protein CVV41_13035 [Candidatus Riflebacteria bacterium HGW-Riflebacteria-1]|nr:MAG: hypothetical protein CVV41_13035 [Candidatus Riflebacteria bacterium HGW-Riflebacteria-1]